MLSSSPSSVVLVKKGVWYGWRVRLCACVCVCVCVCVCACILLNYCIVSGKRALPQSYTLKSLSDIRRSPCTMVNLQC